MIVVPVYKRALLVGDGAFFVASGCSGAQRCDGSYNNFESRIPFHVLHSTAIWNPGFQQQLQTDALFLRYRPATRKRTLGIVLLHQSTNQQREQPGD